jgi:hypothetical protein
MDPSLKPDLNRKGSYYRRIEDIGRALKKLDIDRLPPAMQFLAYYFGCEKLARGVVGIHLHWPATKTYAHGTRIRLQEIETASKALSLTIGADDLVWTFADFNEQSLLRPIAGVDRSARLLRNSLGHDFGPTNVAHIVERAAFHNRRMQRFLECAAQVLAYQRAHFTAIT